MAHNLHHKRDAKLKKQRGGDNMKKLVGALAIVLGLNLVGAMIGTIAQSYAQESPEPQPKPEKPDSE